MTFIILLLISLYSQTVVTGRSIVIGRVSFGSAATGGGGSLSVTVSGVTNTQAILSYTAPSGSACGVEVSESASYSPLDNDVNTALFTGADQDSRATSANNGTARKFVAGSRLPAIALDTHIYSRSLQANTLHYARVNCSGTIGTTTFTTNNIPVGSTWIEMPHIGSLSDDLFGYMNPWLDGTRTQIINDPLTGAQLSPVSLPPDEVGGGSGSLGITIYDGAQQRVCGAINQVDPITGAMGVICNPTSRVGYNHAFLLIPSLGISRLLGLVNPPNLSNGYTFIPSLNDDLSVLSQPGHPSGNDDIYTQQYTGNFAAGIGGTAGSIPLGSATLLSAPPSGGLLINNFDPTFNASLYFCQDPGAPAGGYSFMKCARGSQDSYGWIALFYGGDGRPVPSSCMPGDTLCPRVIAAWNTYKVGVSKFCAIHQTLQVPNETQISVNWHGIDTNAVSSCPYSCDFNVGTAAVYTTLTSGTSAGGTVLHTAGAPTSQATGGDSESTQTYEAGDKIRINGSGNGVVQVASRSGNDLTLTAPLLTSVSTSQQVAATCNVPNGADGVWALSWWKPLDDPTGGDMTSTYVINSTGLSGGGHFDLSPSGYVGESGAGYETLASIGGPIWNVLHNTAAILDVSAQFNGIGSPCFGALCNKHPADHQLTAPIPYFTDRPIFAGGAGGSPSGGRYFSAATGISSITGTLYEYFPDTSFPLQRKLIPTQAILGGYGLLDISGPTTGNQIGGTSGDNFKYCVAYKANECRTGSTAGQVYVNIPSFDYPYCSNDQNPFVRNVCINNMPAYAGALLQGYYGSSTADFWAKSRNLTNGLVGPRNAIVYPMAKSLQDGSYTLFTVGYADYGSPSYGHVDVWKVKMPPLPAPDGTDRTGYLATPVVVAAGSQDNVLAKFWYVENDGHCGTRQDDCYAVASTIPVDPFKYYVDGTSGTLATLAGLSCSAGCTLVIPTAPSHVLYYQLIKRDSSNNILSTGATQVVAVP